MNANDRGARVRRCSGAWTKPNSNFRKPSPFSRIQNPLAASTPALRRDSPRRPAGAGKTLLPGGSWRSQRLRLLDIGFRIRDNEFASSSAILPGDEFLILQSHGCRPLVAGYFLEPKPHENGFKDADPRALRARLCRFEPERLVDEFDSPFDCAFLLHFGLPRLALLPCVTFRRPRRLPTWVQRPKTELLLIAMALALNFSSCHGRLLAS